LLSHSELLWAALSSLGGHERPLRFADVIVTDLNNVFCFVLTVFLMILESTAAEGAAFSSYLVAGTGVRLDLRRIMLEDRAYGPVPPKPKKKLPRPQTSAKTKYSWHANRGPHFTGGWDRDFLLL
jgi:hypothetical protein